MFDQDAVCSANDQPLPHAGGVAIRWTGSNTDLGFVQSLSDASGIIHQSSAMDHKFQSTIQYRTSTLCPVGHHGKCCWWCLTEIFLILSTDNFFGYFVDIDTGSDWVIVSCDGFEDGQVPSRTMIATALDKFSTIGVRIKNTIVVDHRIVSGYYFFPSSVTNGNGPDLVFNLHIWSSGTNACDSFDPRFFVLSMDFGTTSAAVVGVLLDNGGIGG
mmetsp:Transcript_25642/g.27550  ORF Transcript_25642/g.27550 Transcript_25642/m.27550 type:complete len:215 (+) Transcript_25642:132-776(+)